MKVWSRRVWVGALLSAAVLVTTGLGSAILGNATAAANNASIQADPTALGRHLTSAPNKLSIVLVSTPGCGFCKLVREHQLAPLLKDPDFKDIAVFEVLMRDTTAFSKPIKNFHSHTGADLGKIGSVAELSEKLDINLAPTVLFIGASKELAERLVGYGVPDYYFAYLSDRIDTARKILVNDQQK